MQFQDHMAYQQVLKHVHINVQLGIYSQISWAEQQNSE